MNGTATKNAVRGAQVPARRADVVAEQDAALVVATEGVAVDLAEVLEKVASGNVPVFSDAHEHSKAQVARYQELIERKARLDGELEAVSAETYGDIDAEIDALELPYLQRTLLRFLKNQGRKLNTAIDGVDPAERDVASVVNYAFRFGGSTFIHFYEFIRALKIKDLELSQEDLVRFVIVMLKAHLGDGKRVVDEFRLEQLNDGTPKLFEQLSPDGDFVGKVTGLGIPRAFGDEDNLDMVLDRALDGSDRMYAFKLSEVMPMLLGDARRTDYQGSITDADSFFTAVIRAHKGERIFRDILQIEEEMLKIRGSQVNRLVTPCLEQFPEVQEHFERCSRQRLYEAQSRGCRPRCSAVLGKVDDFSSWAYGLERMHETRDKVKPPAPNSVSGVIFACRDLFASVLQSLLERMEYSVHAVDLRDETAVTTERAIRGAIEQGVTPHQDAQNLYDVYEFAERFIRLGEIDIEESRKGQTEFQASLLLSGVRAVTFARRLSELVVEQIPRLNRGLRMEAEIDASFSLEDWGEAAEAAVAMSNCAANEELQRYLADIESRAEAAVEVAELEGGRTL